MVARKRSPFHRDIDAQVEAVFRTRTNIDGEVNLDDVINDLAAWFVGNPAALTAEATRVATAIVRQFDESRRPRPSTVKAGAFQAGLFQPHYLIPYAPNQRVWMEKATREQFAAWMGIRATEAATQAAAHAIVADYQAQRFSAWTPDDDYLIDVERRYFGWVDAADVPEDDDE